MIFKWDAGRRYRPSVPHYGPWRPQPCCLGSSAAAHVHILGATTKNALLDESFSPIQGINNPICKNILGKSGGIYASGMPFTELTSIGWKPALCWALCCHWGNVITNKTWPLRFQSSWEHPTCLWRSAFIVLNTDIPTACVYWNITIYIDIVSWVIRIILYVTYTMNYKFSYVLGN